MRAHARLVTPYGLASCSWSIAGGVFTADVVVPPNTRADFTLPNGVTSRDLLAGQHRFSGPWVVTVPPAPTLDSPLASLIDDGDAWASVVAAVPDLAGIEVGLRGRGDMTVRHVASRLSESARSALVSTLGEIAARRSVA